MLFVKKEQNRTHARPVCFWIKGLSWLSYWDLTGRARGVLIWFFDGLNFFFDYLIDLRMILVMWIVLIILIILILHRRTVLVVGPQKDKGTPQSAKTVSGK